MAILLETKEIKKYYGKERGRKKSGQMLIKAVDGVSLQIEEGKSLALIGESGSGKTTFGKLIAGLEPLTEGKIIFQNKEIQDFSQKEMRKIRKDMQMVFQSSGGVFDPSYTIGESITEILKNYWKMSEKEYYQEVCQALENVGLDETYYHRHAHNLSGGECQRANIARALALHPKLVICDEPVSSLDYSIRKKILNLLKDMQEKYGLTYLLITHDLSNVPYVCQHVAIMYQGRIVEYMKRADDLEERVVHPYSRLLYQSIPAKSPRERKLLRIPLSLTESFETGCGFQNRCSQCTDQCRTQMPKLQKVAEGHYAACHCCE